MILVCSGVRHDAHEKWTVSSQWMNFQRRMDLKGHWTDSHLQHRWILMHVSADLIPPVSSVSACVVRWILMLEKHISPTQMSDFSRAFRADLTCECASRLLRGTSSIIGVSHRVSDARKRSFVRSLISYCPLEGSVAHSCRYEAQLKEERKDHLRWSLFSWGHLQELC